MNQPKLEYGPPIEGQRCRICKLALYQTPSGLVCKGGHGSAEEDGEPTATFDTARYYTTSDDEERLIHEDPEEAIQEWLGGFWSSENIEEEIRKCCPLLINGYAPDIPDAKLRKKWSNLLAEQFLELYMEDHGDPESCGGMPNSPTLIAFDAAVDTGVEETNCWLCKIVGSQLFEYDAVIKIAKEDYPEWFEKDENADK